MTAFRYRIANNCYFSSIILSTYLFKSLFSRIAGSLFLEERFLMQFSSVLSTYHLGRLKVAIVSLFCVGMEDIDTCVSYMDRYIDNRKVGISKSEVHATLFFLQEIKQFDSLCWDISFDFMLIEIFLQLSPTYVSQFIRLHSLRYLQHILTNKELF